MRFTLKNPRSLQYIDYQNVRKTEFLGCQSQDRRCHAPPEFCTLPKFLGGAWHLPIGHLMGIFKGKSYSAFVKANLMVFFAFLQVENATKFAFAKANTCHVKSYNTPKLMIIVSFCAL